MIRINDSSEFQELIKYMLPGYRAYEEWLTLQVIHNSDFRGFCANCGKVNSFIAKPRTGWINLRNTFICSKCNLTARHRMFLECINQIATNKKKIHIFEQLTSFFSILKEKFPSTIGSEYLGKDKIGGQVYEKKDRLVRHEDMHIISYDDQSMDLLLHQDVFEHLTDVDLAMSECCRVLKKGGTMLFMAPIFPLLDQSRRRASVKDGEIVHHLPPIYHGNPVDHNGALVLEEFGIDFFERIIRVGFSEIEILMDYDPHKFYVTDANPNDNAITFPIAVRAIH